MVKVRFYYGDTTGQYHENTYESRALAEDAIGRAARMLGWLGIIIT